MDPSDRPDPQASQATVQRAPPTEPEVAAGDGAVQIGARFGRYIVLERVGAGGMGVVYAAFDPELDRKVALKLLWPGSRDPAGQADTRLVREARTMARLSHPNIVAVYDVGVEAGRIFIAMDFVEGQSLRGWLEHRHPWTEVLDVFVRAGLGLEQAHASGLVHRDFKPDNVLLGREGRVCVTDFGLAQSQLGPEEVTDGPIASPLVSRLTATGTILGSPAYMAPEQHTGGAADARSDQFSFCVSLYEGLFGRRPFRGDDFAALEQSKREGVAHMPGGDAPEWVKGVIARGLLPDPGARWPSMSELLDGLRADPRRARRRWLAIGSVGITTATVGLLVVERGGSPRCTTSAERLAGVWDDDQRAAVRRSFFATGLTYAEDTVDRISQRLDVYADGWVDAHRSACEEGLQIDQRMRCLDSQRSRLAALVGVLADADAGVVEHAARATSRLPAPAGCQNLAARLNEPAPPADPVAATEVERIVAALPEVEALHDAGRYRDGLAIVQGLLEPAAAAGHAPTTARVHYWIGMLETQLGGFEQAEHSLSEAFWLASTARDDVLAAESAGRLVVTVGIRAAREREALQWARHCETALARVHGEAAGEARLLDAVGRLYFKQARLTESLALLERAVALRRETLGPDHPDLAISLEAVGNTLFAAGRGADAEQYHARALAIRERAFGPGHPGLSASLTNLGVTMARQRRFARAHEYLDRSIALLEPALGARHTRLAPALNTKGLLAFQQGELVQSLAYLERAASIQEWALGPDHPDVAEALNNLSSVMYSLGRYAAAEIFAQRALAIAEVAHGPGHVKLIGPLANAAHALQGLGRGRGAVRYYRRAAALSRRGGTTAAGRARILSGLGQTLLDVDDARGALAVLEEALSLRQPEQGNPVSTAGIRFAVARALTRLGIDRSRTRELIASARADYEAAGKLGTIGLEDLDAWAAVHLR